MWALSDVIGNQFCFVSPASHSRHWKGNTCGGGSVFLAITKQKKAVVNSKTGFRHRLTILSPAYFVSSTNTPAVTNCPYSAGIKLLVS
ncbi:hypothetical protein M0802_008863 [Mischocyttarus mexicanus]|nr:hypothetical protein M0802_008863 [Mischocyttarus mexicanus]